MLLSSFLSVDKAIVNHKCYTNVRELEKIFIENQSENVTTLGHFKKSGYILPYRKHNRKF